MRICALPGHDATDPLRILCIRLTASTFHLTYRQYPLNREEFLRFLQQQHCEENFEFVSEVHDLHAKLSTASDANNALPDVQRITQV